MENLYQRLIENSASDYYPYHMPGHKRQPMGSVLDEAYALDITEIDNFDNLHQPQGLIAGAQERAGRLYHAEETFYLVNGSTCGILSALSAAAEAGGHILLARNSHKSAYHGVYLRSLKVTYLYPQCDEYGIACGITAEQVKEALKRDRTIRAVFLTSPTYEGRVSEVRKIAELVHDRGLILIVDEAHGAHLGIHPAWPENSNQAGADIVIHSLHKTLPSMTQTALLHVNGNRVNRDRLRRFLRIYQTSSPSYVFMASMEQAIAQMEAEGRERFECFLNRWQQMLQALGQCQRIKAVPTDDFGKLVLSVRGTDITGRQLYEILLQEYHLQLEMSAPEYALAMFTVSDTREGFVRMTEALLAIDKTLKEAPFTKETPIQNSEKEDSLLLSEAWDAETEVVDLLESVGRRAGEFVNLYPPGIPLLVPGEKITASDAELLQSLCRKHLPVQGLIQRKEIQEIIVIKNK